MRIASSALQMQAQHSTTRLHTRSERLQMWVGERPGAPSSRATASAPAATSTPRLPERPTPRADLAAPHTSAARRHSREDEEHLSPVLSMMRDLIERMTGVRAQSVRTVSDAEAAPSPTASSSAPSNSAPVASAGFGVAYERHEVLEETESTQWAAEGVIHTTDGQEIRFQMQLQMQRAWRVESHAELYLGDAVKPVDPLVINFDGTAAQLQSTRFAFDLDGDGQTEQVPLLAGNRGYLALDLNGNQQIDNGLELFGPATGNGYGELARYDGDGNGWIDEGDAVYAQLRIWIPSAQGPGELHTLKEAGVGALSLTNIATPFALRDTANTSLGAVRASSIYLRENGSVGHTQQVDLSV